MVRLLMGLALLALPGCRARRRRSYSCAQDAEAGENISRLVCPPRTSSRSAVALGPGYTLRWLHVPKCGTSLATAVYRAACPLLPARAAIPRPTSPYPGHVQDYYAQCFPEEISQCFLHPADTLRPSPTHVPIGAFAPARHAYATMLRDPWQRLLSAWRWKAQFFDPPCTELSVACAHRNRGIYVNMINGNWTREPRSPPVKYPDQNDVERATSRLEAFAFVGLVEKWVESICLFHAVFGGEVTKGELFNTRPGALTRTKAPGVGLWAKPAEYDTPMVPGLEDSADNRLYASAQALFERRFRAAFAPD